MDKKKRLTSSRDKVPDILKAMEGGMSARKACEVNDVPISTFMLWLSQDAELADQYTRARELGLEKMADDIIAISDNDMGDPQRDRLKVDSRKWLLSKMMPKKYGDKLDVTSGGDRLPAVTINVPPIPDGGPQP